MIGIEVLDTIPEISLIDEEDLSLETIQTEMIQDYEAYYEELTGEELTLYPADERRLMINTVAGKILQLAEIINDRFQQNFLKYMYGDYLKNWAANFGYTGTGVETAEVTVRFYRSKGSEGDITIPEGTQVTAGDDVFFETEYEETLTGDYIDIAAKCTEAGAAGNGYAPGQINILADPIAFIESVENTTESSGGHDEYTDDELKEKILNYTSTYSNAGPKEAYEEFAEEYSGEIKDARAITEDDATVSIYILLQGNQLPDEAYCRKVLEYFDELELTPDTDRVNILAPVAKEYEVRITYYITEDKKELEEEIQEAMEDAVSEFTEYTSDEIGRAITPDILISYAMAAGAARVVIDSPEYTKIGENEVAICTKSTVTFGGIE